MTEGWTDFLVATVGAAAALAGLIIVAISVNIKAIIDIPGMASRAGATVASLVLALIGGSVLLIPTEDPAYLGLPILIAAVIVAIIVVSSARAQFRAAPAQPTPTTWAKVAVAVVQVLPFVVGAVALLGGNGDGIGWVAAGILLVFAGSVLNAWVLLVEILR